jgi:crotonobetainyl-CoA:carnitine CoA-transferase CaiB-like acyl-CoA transferase
VIEKLRPGALEKLGYGYDTLKQSNPRLIYCSARGFLKGPYENRTALDEVAQMMGGLAYMTGPIGRPLRAGASVIDVMGGMFGVIGILAALEKRHNSGEGQNITSSLYESTVFLVGQHMAQNVVTGQPADPMPARISAWAIYDVFDVAHGEKLFVGVVSDSQWKIFCRDFDFSEFAANRAMDTNTGRVGLRSEIMPIVAARFATLSIAELSSKLEKSGLPYAPITKPQDLFDDVHLNNSDGLLNVGLPDGSHAKLPALPISMGDKRFGLNRDVPSAGQHSKEILLQLGLTSEQIDELFESGAAG